MLPVEAACGYRQNEFFPFWPVGPGLNPVQPKKYDARVREGFEQLERGEGVAGEKVREMVPSWIVK